MRIILLSFISVIFSAPVLSQPEFKIALDHIEWKNPRGDKVTLEINLKISNIGNSEGACEDLIGIWLYSTDPFYKYDINFLDWNRKILQPISPGDFIYSFISFEVPKAAGGLYLKFREEYGGAEKSITDSYNQYIIDMAENYYSENKYSEAINEFNSSIKNDPSQKIKFELRIADCYEKIGGKYMDDYEIYKISDNLEKSIEEYKLCLKFDPKRSSVKEKIAKSYDMLGDLELKASNLSGAIIFYNSSLLYNNSQVINGKIKGINNQISGKKEKENEIKTTKLKWEEYDYLISPTVGFAFTSGVGYHSNKDVSKNNPFWNLQMNIPVKVYTEKKMKSPFNVFLNFETGYSGFIGSENDLSNYLNIDRTLLKLERNSQGPILSEYYFNGGIGVSILNVDFIPMIAIDYGVYGQSTFFDLTYLSSSNPILGSNNLSKAHIGQGVTIELSIKIGKSFFSGYSFKSYKIKSELAFLNNVYSAHYFSIGLTSF
ncbi:MAG: hypothetical protein WAT71_11865 [Ignavibacteria bacterium]